MSRSQDLNVYLVFINACFAFALASVTMFTYELLRQPNLCLFQVLRVPIGVFVFSSCLVITWDRFRALYVPVVAVRFAELETSTGLFFSFLIAVSFGVAVVVCSLYPHLLLAALSGCVIPIVLKLWHVSHSLRGLSRAGQGEIFLEIDRFFRRRMRDLGVAALIPVALALGVPFVGRRLGLWEREPGPGQLQVGEDAAFLLALVVDLLALVYFRRGRGAGAETILELARRARVAESAD